MADIEDNALLMLGGSFWLFTFSRGVTNSESDPPRVRYLKYLKVGSLNIVQYNEMYRIANKIDWQR